MSMAMMMNKRRRLPIRIGAGWKIEFFELGADCHCEQEVLLAKLLFTRADSSVSTESVTVYFQRNLVHEEGCFVVCYITRTLSKSYRYTDISGLETGLMELVSSMQPDLQPFSFPPGWYIHLNHFTTRDPQLMSPDDWENEPWMHEDLALFEYRAANTRWSIDIGYYPENSPEGSFACYLLKDDEWETPVAEFRSPSQTKVALNVQQWIDQIGTYVDGIEA